MKYVSVVTAILAMVTALCALHGAVLAACLIGFLALSALTLLCWMRASLSKSMKPILRVVSTEHMRCQHCDRPATAANPALYVSPAECDRDKLCCDDCQSDHRTASTTHTYCWSCAHGSRHRPLQPITIAGVTVNGCPSCSALLAHQAAESTERRVLLSLIGSPAVTCSSGVSSAEPRYN